MSVQAEIYVSRDDEEPEHLFLELRLMTGPQSIVSGRGQDGLDQTLHRTNSGL